jgi:hypothetical protein
VYGIRTTAQALADNPDALEMWMTWVTGVLYQVRRELGLETGECRDCRDGVCVDDSAAEDERPLLRLVDFR